jgi:hypothetical protein
VDVGEIIGEKREEGREETGAEWHVGCSALILAASDT